MSQGIYQANTEEIRELYKLIEVADFRVLRIIEVWFNLSNEHGRAAEPDIFITYLRDRVRSGIA